jgi:hypothetical protein
MNDSMLPVPFGPSASPKTIGQILDRTYKLGRANWKLFFGIATLPSVAIFLVFAVIVGCMVPLIGPGIAAAQASGGKAAITPPAYFPYLISFLMLLTYPILFAVFAVYMPAASYAATQADCGVKVTFGNAYGLALSRFWRYLWLIILPAFYVIVPMAAVVVAVGLGALLLRHGSSGIGAASGGLSAAAMFFLIALMILLYIGLMIYCIWLMLRFFLAFPASVTEGLTAWASLKRSARLTKGAKGRIFLVMLVVYASTYLVNLVLMMIILVVAAIGAVVAVVAHVAEGSPVFFILIGLGVLGYLLGMVACAMFSYVAYSTSCAVLYNDQRLRKDGPLLAPAQAEGLA